ncbi:MAG: sugar transferase [Clostridia bacterium]|nr:sugar transferase [Clostridia bacterium]
MYQFFFKRFFDVLLSLIGVIVFALPMVLISVAILIDDPGPVFFCQERVGKGKKGFRLFKFRSMKVDTPNVATHLLENPEQYISRVGGFLRRSSLDELPQLFNILLGQMSIVGPRPALYSQKDLLEERDRYGANDVLPGLTGWAQVNGRDELEISEKAKLDGEYVKRLSFFFDAKYFLKTIGCVFRGDGVVEGGTGGKPKQNLEESE